MPGFLFFFKKFIYFNWKLITSQYCSGFAIHWHESAMGVLVFPILNRPPSYLPPHPIPLGHPSAPALINNAFKSQNGVTVVQVFKIELWGHCGYGFRHVPILLRHWIFWTVSDPRIPPAILKIESASCQLQCYSLKVPPKTMQPFQTPINPYLTATLTSC